MHSSGWLWSVVDWAPFPILTLVGAKLVWGRLQREFPLFFVYVIATELVGVLRFAAQYRDPHVYFYVYWISDQVLNFITFLVVCELFALKLFAKFYKLRIYRYLFVAAALVIGLGAWLSSMEPVAFFQAALVFDRVFDFVIVALLLFFISLMLVMGRDWGGKFTFGIVFGLVILTAGDLIAKALFESTKYRRTSIGEIAPFTFDIACLIWLWAFWTKPKVSTPAPAPLQPEMVAEARRWETILKEWIGPGNKPSLDDAITAEEAPIHKEVSSARQDE